MFLPSPPLYLPLLSLILFSILHLTPTNAQMQVFYPNDPRVIWSGTSLTLTAGAASFTNAAAYDGTRLNPPPAPSPPIATAFTVPIASDAGNVPNLSIPQSGAFAGFSIEMSVATQVLGKNSSVLFVPFLNLLSNIVARAGGVQVRVGGNTQEDAELKDSLPDGTILAKDYANIFNPTGTPPLEYTRDLVYMMGNISNLVNVRWYTGIPFFQTDPVSLDMALLAQEVLGDRLIALQAGNEPDLYTVRGRTHRPAGYGPVNYTDDIGNLIAQVSANASLPRQNDIWLVPSISSKWEPDDVWDTGIVDAYLDNLNALTVQRYPHNNCAFFYQDAPLADPQTLFADYLNHASTVALASTYASSAALAVAHGKPLLMFETNTASCSGFAGLSDAFGAALWGLDWTLTLAATNFSGALFHTGGQRAFYNPFSPPPTNQSAFRQWTVGPVYYSALAAAEVFGPGNGSRVVDLEMNEGEGTTPGYAVYEGGVPVKVALFNMADGSVGGQAYTASVQLGGGAPESVKVKRLSASSVSQKGNFTWAGQTFGNAFESDGRLTGDLAIETVPCDAATSTCSVSVPAPGFALVFLTGAAFAGATPDASAVQTFPTTYFTRTINTAQVDPSALATSNGHAGAFGGGGFWATSPGDRDRSGSAGRLDGALGVGMLTAVVGAVVMLATRTLGC
ncbi:glycoside hydrolase family 79 protein [Amylostereum chailletii]|nr:glycoside hydrolase family 79 protein [Amylostereum chailletii]